MNSSTDKPLIELRSVVKVYESLAGSVTALNGIDLQVFQGEFLVVTGKSGSGKTTLVNMLTGLDRSTSGEIWVNGEPLHKFGPEKAARLRGRTMGVIFQTFELLPTLTVLQNVMLPMDFARRYSRWEQRKRAYHLLEQVGIADHARKLPTALSGGQQQRLAIARAMANDPAILVADEPTGSLDSATANAVVDIFAGLVQEGGTVFLVTHDKDIAKFGSRVITLSDGEIV
ncbi:MAG TPA: ABC transporter ATP-binding protein [Anaerolineales bacterium]|nr:ABC transporter ATP-binding protein [Anaerolineales bacterium]HMX20855.1 ABC transporter ATP-binding protein [Anaerolineales bacterium]HMX73903.1 ABC transporter ATP-binding protein [Anaerolineales bacterium]HMZ41899.1 ABC transporter ATP-binding protein [Anaerolineales bacterium]HNA55814.1 ABC transporter ATP-binding protein [Anaerolineales bacterium]